VSVDEIRVQFREVILGKSRGQLLSAYSDLLLAKSLASHAEDNAKSGVIPGKVAEERINTRTNMESTLLSLLEELTFSAQQSCQQAESQFEDAQNRCRISLQTVATLLGRSPAEITGTITAEDAESALGLLQVNSLSLVQLRAPFSGTVERRIFSTNERVAAGDSLLTLADTSTLWVAADLREREWNALTLKSGDPIRVLTTTTGAQVRSATVHFVGREVDPSTNAVPLIAILDNADGTLRPGMFVRVVVPVAETRKTLTVPESSILEHDRQTFVFVPVSDSTFRRVDIERGIQTAGVVEVLSGLNAGDKVVAGGGFYLKSELLLQGESE
jgi:cobalt-zinc-cadmium efflux system membrane fusion protein